MLLGHILHQRLERRTIGFDAVGPGIAGEQFVYFPHGFLDPRQHVRVRASPVQPHEREVLGLDECLVEAARDPGVLLVSIAPDCDQMHDGKDASFGVEGTLDRSGIREDRNHVGMRMQVACTGERIDLSFGEQLAERGAAVVALKLRGLKQRRCARIAVAACFLDRALDPADGRKIDSVLMHEMATNPHRRRLRVERHSHPAVLEILRSFDSRMPVDIDMAVPKDARRKHRDCDQRALAARQAADELGGGKFGDVEFLAAPHAVKDFARRIDRNIVEMDALGGHVAGT